MPEKGVITTCRLIGCVWGIFFLYLISYTLFIIFHEGLSELHGQNVGMLYVIIIYEAVPNALLYFVIPSLILIIIGRYICHIKAVVFY